MGLEISRWRERERKTKNEKLVNSYVLEKGWLIF